MDDFLPQDEFLSSEDLDLRNCTREERDRYFQLWFLQAQASNELDKNVYNHGVFAGCEIDTDAGVFKILE